MRKPGIKKRAANTETYGSLERGADGETAKDATEAAATDNT